MRSASGAPPEVRRLVAADPDFTAQLDALLAWDRRSSPQVEQAAARIIADVRAHGDEALLRLSRRHDGWAPALARDFEIPASAWDEALAGLPDRDRQALESAAARIRRYHERQPTGAFEFTDEAGLRLGQRVVPMRRVGVYAPGGQAAYPSSVLMTVVPARVAGVKEVIVVSPTPGGHRNPHVLAALRIAGVDRAFALGGAQAIAALAHGTATVPRVDKIVGPGGAFVAAAKRLVFGPVGVDFIAGPSEVVIVADGTAPARWLALDLFAQAEHDADAQAVIISPDAGYLDAVHAEMAKVLPAMTRRRIIERSLAARGAMILARDLAEAIHVANRFAPEHLELAVRDAERWLDVVESAGAVFVGAGAAEALGDYSAGPSHVLPTAGAARYASPLGVVDFQTRMSVIAGAAPQVAGLAATIAEAEGLTAHAAAAAARLEE